MVGGKGVAGAGDCSRGHTYGMVSCSPAPYFVADAHAPFSLNILIAGIIVLLTSRDARRVTRYTVWAVVHLSPKMK